MSRSPPDPEREPPTSVLEGSVTGAESVRGDARLLAAGSPAVRVAVLSDRSLSVGVAVPAAVPYLSRARTRGLPVVRRETGGTAILHAPGDLAWSIVLPRADPRVGADFVHGYARLGAGVVAWLRNRGVVSEWGPPPGSFEDYCLLSARGQVLRAGGQVLGGAAQHATRAALLHHGILPYAVDRPLLRDLFGMPDAGGADRLVGLDDLGLREPPERLAREPLDALVATPIGP